MKNKFCNLNNLRNESDVEQFFIIKLLFDLGYKEEQIYTKSVITKKSFGKGKKKKYYIPNYIVYVGKLPVLVIEAKSVNLSIDEYLNEAQEYSTALNRDYIGINPVKYCLISNGTKTILVKPDENKPILTMKFNDFVDGNKNYNKLIDLISSNKIKIETNSLDDKFEFKTPDLDELRGVLVVAHNYIRSKEKIGPKKAFYEFCKLLFIKMNEDKKLEDKIEKNEQIDINTIPFSVKYIDKLSESLNSPINVLFEKNRDDLEEQVLKGEKKRIFRKDEKIELSASTIKKVVELIQHYNLRSVEDDINGKVFETFLESSVRGKELGQFFTPRSVVRFMVKLANLKIKYNNGHYTPDMIIDGSCGTGGFLIFALSDLFEKIPEELTSFEKKELLDKIKCDSLYGVDASNDQIVPVARMNMYLHGDGGSHIFLADTLDKEVYINEDDDKEVVKEKEELRELFSTPKFDVVLTNPPFSMKYESTDEEQKRILEQYELAKSPNGRLIKSLKSNIMFFERYRDILKPGGKLLTVIDESVLNTDGQGRIMFNFRKWLMKNFIIKAIISLPKNTFVNQDAGVKTSILYLTKKIDDKEEQSSIFMAISNDVGHNDAGRITSENGDLHEIYVEYKKFITGEFK